MTIVSSVGGLISSVNDKVDTITAAANGILCLPYILTEGLGGLINTAINTLATSLSSIASGILDLVSSMVSDVIGKIIGAVNSILDRITGIFNFIKDLKDAVKKLLRKIRNALTERANCKFVAAGLYKCILGSVANNISKKSVSGVGRVTSLINLVDQKTQEITDKITQPGELIDKYVDKAASMATKATKTVNAIQLF
jgi:phage-related protein